MINIDKWLLFFDTETTGILKDEKNNIVSNWDLIQLAYRLLKNWKKEDKNIFFNTDTKIEISSMAIHWIYPELLRKKSNWKYLDDEAREKLSKIFSENILVAHNIDFDKDVLEKSWIKYSSELIDTLKVARIMWDEGVLKGPNQEEPEFMNLQYLRYFFELYEIRDSEWKLECTTAHDAFWDVVVLENVFYELFKRMKNILKLSDWEIIEKMMEMTKKEFIMVKKMRVGKYRWRTFEEVYNIDKWYLQWMIGADFSEDIKYTAKVWLWLQEDKKFFK